jgi:hypothetical protein
VEQSGQAFVFVPRIWQNQKVCLELCGKIKRAQGQVVFSTQNRAFQNQQMKLARTNWTLDQVPSKPSQSSA